MDAHETEPTTTTLVITAEQRRAVEAEPRRTDVTRRVRARLDMVKAAARARTAGHGQSGGACAHGWTWSKRRRWATTWRALPAGAGARVRPSRTGWRVLPLGVLRHCTLPDAPRSGRPVQADTRYLAALETALETGPTALGLACDVWTSQRL